LPRASNFFAAQGARFPRRYGTVYWIRGLAEAFGQKIGETAMEVILKEDVIKLGNRGDVVKVADGYGRNYLLPEKLAIEANAANKAVIEQMKASAVRKSVKEKAGAEQLAAQLGAVELVFERKVGENEHLFGSVTSGDIAHQLEAKGYTIDRRKISLDEPLKTIGEYHVPIKLHREVTSHVKVTVKGEQEEVEAAANA
jgi:large subunit ribosomal protein L9